MNGIEIQGDLFQTKDDNPAILSIDHTKEKDVVALISTAQQKGSNSLDLSKRNIKDFSAQLLELTALQYLYLEGNKLIQLPTDLFLRLPHLKWLDLRNNQLTSIPSLGLAKHRSLQYFLLSRNRLRTLPSELGKVKSLSALNLDGNPLDHPPFAIIKQGIKAIQQYLREELTSDHDSSFSSDDEQEQEETPRFSYPRVSSRKSNSEVGYYQSTSSNLLPPHLQSCIQYKRMTYSAIRPSSFVRSRPQSEMRFSQMKSKIGLKTSNTPETDDYQLREQSLIHLKHHDIKIDDEIEQLRQQSFITNYEEPIIHTPFYVGAHYSPMMTNDQQNGNRYDRRRNHAAIDEEERRKHDRQIQDRIRQITDRMLRRRLEARSSLFEEKRQVRLELREIRRLESDASKQSRLKSQKKP